MNRVSNGLLYAVRPRAPSTEYFEHFISVLATVILNRADDIAVNEFIVIKSDAVYP